LSNRLRIFLGWDAAQMRAWVVAERSAQVASYWALETNRVSLTHLQHLGVYWRPTRPRLNADMSTAAGYWDELSEAPMSTGHAIARFLVPHLCGYQGWAVFMDGDVLVRADLAELFALADERYAVQVVQHAPLLDEGQKMTGALQTTYARKNWSSVMLFNCGHPANRRLDLPLVNTVPGRDLHRFCWLEDAEIGALPAGWNYLVGHSPAHVDPGLVHFTDGVPDMPGYEHAEYADEWYDVARRCGYRLSRPAARGARIA